MNFHSSIEPEPRLEQGHIRKRDALEDVDEGFGVGCAREIVEEAARDRQLARHVGGDLEMSSNDGVGVELLPLLEFRGDAFAA